jgi:CHAT domain-containing protein
MQLGGLHISMGDYAKAEPLLKQAMQIMRKTLGENDPGYAGSLAYLGILYDNMGEYAKAKDLREQELEILRKTYGENHIACAWAFYGLSGIYFHLGDYARAEALRKQSLEIWRKTYGENHPRYSMALGDLARLYCFMGGEYAKAEPLYKQAMEIRRKTVGENHPLYATSLNDLARLYQAMGDYAKSESLHKQAMDLRLKLFGENHPDYVRSLIHLAVLYTAWDKPVESLEYFNRCMTSSHGHTVKVLAGLSQERKLSFFNGVLWKLEMYLSFVLRYPNAPGSVAGGALWLARWKALSMELQTEQYRLQHEMRTLLDQMEAARREVARWTLSPPAGVSAEEARRKREENEARLAEVEDALAKTSGEFAEVRKLGSADLTQIAQALPKDSALLDFARFRRCNFRPFTSSTGAAMGKEPQWGESRYVVFITPSRSTLDASRSTDQVVLIDLGPAQPIDDAVAAFRAAIESPTTNHVSRFTDHESRITEPLKTLSTLVLDRILPHVKDRKHLIICPDGQLALVPFECLQTNDGKYLVESFQISYLGAGREAVAYGGREAVTAQQSPPLLIGDPDFDLLPGTLVAAAKPAQEQQVAMLRGLRASPDLGAIRFNRLAGTRTEVELAGKMLVGSLLLDRQATEEAVKRASRPEVLYLATHGFFLPDQEMPSEEKGGPRGVVIGEERQPGPKARIENPLLRCGLALAGANRRDSVPADSGADDGILTGMEVAGLDLWGTKLVVLSACETGIGDVKQGEGVMGLRRAFLLAGARRVLATLWKVPDEQTEELMTDFVKRWQAGTPAVKALREAQLAMIERLRKEKGQAHPFFWSAFTMTGDWR